MTSLMNFSEADLVIESLENAPLDEVLLRLEGAPPMSSSAGLVRERPAGR